jgi:heme/copper-type cytochrome/quinol oxidase subunit 3
MAAATHAIPAPPPTRPRVLIVGTAFATAATLMVLVGLVGVYLLERAAVISAGDTWLPEGVIIPLQQPTVMLFTLLASSVTIQWAVYAVARNDKVNTYIALGMTFLFGFGFVNMCSYLYTLMGLDITASPQAVLIYAISGAHLAMLIGAMLFVAVTSFRALAGQETSRAHDGVSASALFWHATVAAYFVIWYAVYVTK